MRDRPGGQGRGLQASPARIVLARTIRGHRPGRLRRDRFPGFPEHPLAQVHRFELVAVVEQHLGLAQEQEARVGQREVELADDGGLGLGVEVHQRVPGHQQIHPGDGRIAGQVVTPEYHLPAQITAEGMLRAAGLEVLLAELLADLRNLAFGIDARARLGQGALVEVGGVDLHPADELVQAHGLHQHDGQGVGLLASRAARAPDPERAAGALGGQQLGQDLLAQRLPGQRVAEEPCHVDEQAVEKLGELVRLEL